MKQENINYLAVGSFVLLMIALLLFGLYHLTGRRADTDTYYVQMHNVSGIREGTTVTYAGFDVGQVQAIEPRREAGQTTYELTLGIRPDWPIPEDSKAQVVMPSLLGEKQIDISEGDARKLLQPGDRLQSAEAVDMINLMSSVSSEFEQLSREGLLPLLRNLNEQVVETVPPLVSEARALLQSLNTSATRLAAILDATNRQRINSTLANAQDMTASLSTVARRLNETGDEIDALVSATSQLVSENEADIRKTVVEMRSAMEAVSARLDAILYNLDSTSRNLNEFSRQVRDNPAAIINSRPPRDISESHRQ